MKTKGEIVREWRTAKGLTTLELADKVGTSRQNIENLENDSVGFPRYLHKLAAVMGYEKTDDFIALKWPTSEDIVSKAFQERGIEAKRPTASEVPEWLRTAFSGRRYVPDLTVRFPNGDIAFVELKSPSASNAEVTPYRELARRHPSAFCIFQGTGSDIGEAIDRWLKDREAVGYASHNPPEMKALQAHQVSDLSFETVPPLSWEELMSEDRKGKLPTTFLAMAPDDAMAPLARAGHELLFRVGHPLKPGAGIIVRDSNGALFLRQYREGKKAGHWIAHALNSAYRSLDSDEEPLEIVAVLRAPMRGWEDL